MVEKEGGGAMKNFVGLLTAGMYLVYALGAMGQTAPLSGSAVVAGHSGRAQARVPVGPIHEGRFETRDLVRGSVITERGQIFTGRDGHLCLLLSPGALMHVAPNTQVEILELRHNAPGLPRKEDDLVRVINLQANGGGLYVEGGAVTPTTRIRIRTPAGSVNAEGGIFSLVALSDEGSWSIRATQGDLTILPEDGSAAVVKEGQYGILRRDGLGKGAEAAQAVLHRFEFCRGFFRDLDTFRHPILGFDRRGVSEYLGPPGGAFLQATQGVIADASPSFRVPADERPGLRVPPPSKGPEERRWSEERIWAWWRDIGVIRGVNYVPRSCVNSVEMWMADTFDPDAISEELGWAKDCGFTAVRVPLQFAVYRGDPRGFLDRMERFLQIASDRGLLTVPVLFDDLNRAGHEPELGPQPPPTPGQHNPQWVPSPGPTRVTNPQYWKELEDYQKAVMRRFRTDRRILYWDLYNTAGNDGLWDRSLPLLERAFDWAREINPAQPIAVPAWKDLGSPMSARKLERSDLVTFQSFESAPLVEAQIQLLKRYNRPIVLVDFLMRQRDSRLETILPVCATYGVGWFSRGLAQGRTQTWIQDAPFANPEAPDVWQADVLKEDGEPYDREEINLIRAFRYLEKR